jgi:prolipoprotein diacylglyceryltransferase
MYPDLSYLFHDLFGTEPDNWTSIFKTFGLLLVIAILVAAYILYSELKRKSTEGLFPPIKATIKEGEGPSTGEIISNALFGFILGFKVLYAIQHFPEFQANPADIILSSKGNWIGGIVGALAFGGYRWWDKNRRKLPEPKITNTEIFPHDLIGDITILAAISGLIGAKVFALVEDLPSFFEDPLGTFFSGSGLAIYGGLIGGFIGVSIYLRKRKIPIIHVLDAVAPALIIAYGIGRLGCHFSGDGDWGIVNTLAQPSWWFLPDWLWAFDYPQNVLREGVSIPGCEAKYCTRLEPKVFPTPIYETTMAFIIGGILWALRKRITIPGILFFIYLIFNGVERFLIEKIRVNDKYEVLGIQSTQAEFIATILFLIGVAGCLVLWRRHRQIAT